MGLRKVGLLPSCASVGGTGTFLPPFVRLQLPLACARAGETHWAICEVWWEFATHSEKNA